MTAFPLSQLDQFNHVVSLDKRLDDLIRQINAATAELHAVTSERAWLTGDTSYRGWEVKPDGMVLRLPQITIKPIEVPAPPTIEARVTSGRLMWIKQDGVEVPLHEGGHIGLLTSGYTAERVGVK